MELGSSVNSLLLTVMFSVAESVSTCDVWAVTSTFCWISPVSRLMSTRSSLAVSINTAGAIELFEAGHLCDQPVLAALQKLERVLARLVRDGIELHAGLHVSDGDLSRWNDAPDESSTVPRRVPVLL